MSQQRLARAGALLEPRLALAREWPVPRELTVGVRLGDVLELLADHVRPVEWNARGQRRAPAQRTGLVMVGSDLHTCRPSRS